MGEFSLTHWLVIAVIGIVFFGPKRLPQLGSSLGESIRGFKKALNDHHDTQDNQASTTQASSHVQEPQAAPRRETLQAQDIEHTHTTTTTTVKDTTHS